MCGIVGVVHRDREQPAARGAVRVMCDAMRHRGPDDDGIFAEGPAALGMVRLSIIDIGGSRQPIFNEDRSKVIVFNGEIYNYRELRRELVAKGHHFTTQGDTETILHLYEEMGERCVERLRGMFTFAIWDLREQVLFLARDRFGIKPMYVRAAQDGIAFASELKSLVAADLTDRRLDLDALDMFLQLGYIVAPASPFADVRKLEPGHALRWTAREGARSWRYWDLPREERPAPRYVEEAVLAWIDESVTAHLESDVPIAAFLSGGMDSSAIVASMASVGAVPHAFTARYHGSGADATDETGLARLLADRYGARLSVIDVRPEVGDIFEPIVRALDEPHADETAIPTWLISEAVASQYKVALSGAGGDELFAGYRRHAGLLAGDIYGKVPAPIRRLVQSATHALPEPRDGGLAIDRMKRFVRGSAALPAERFLGFVTRLADEERRALYATPRDTGTARERFRALHEQGGARTGLAAGLYLDFKTFLPDDVLAVSDRLSMAHSLEVRVPLVDHVLVEHAFPLPASLKLGLRAGKKVLRQALRSRLPDAHFRAPKRGFVGPTASWLRNELRPLLTDELSPDRMQRLGLFDHRVVSSLLDDHFQHRHNREGILLALLTFSTWHRLYVESAPAPARESLPVGAA